MSDEISRSSDSNSSDVLASSEDTGLKIDVINGTRSMMFRDLQFLELTFRYVPYLHLSLWRSLST